MNEAIEPPTRAICGARVPRGCAFAKDEAIAAIASPYGLREASRSLLYGPDLIRTRGR